MPPPTNISFATATDVGALPASISQNVNDSGTTYTVFYKYTASIDDAIGVFAFGDLIAYTAELHVFEDSNLTNEWLALGFSASIKNIPIQMPVRSGHTYYFKIISSSGNVATAVLNLSVLPRINGNTAIGDLLVLDDEIGNTAPFPATVTDFTNGNVKKLSIKMPISEMGVGLPNGYIAILSEDDNKLHIWNTGTWTETSVVDVFPGGGSGTQGAGALGSNHVDSFYVGNHTAGPGSTIQFKKVKFDGTILATYNVGGTTPNLSAADAAHDDSILYYGAFPTGGGAGSATPIKRYDLVNNVGLSDLSAGFANYESNELKVMGDATIICLFDKAGSTIVRRFDTSGTVLNTYDFGAVNTGVVARIDLAPDEPTSYWIMIHDADINGNLTNDYRRIKVSDGSQLAQVTSIQFEGGTSQYFAPVSNPVRWGPSFSCPLIVLRVVSTGGGGGLTGTVVVNKVLANGVTSNQQFTITAGGGLVPGSFNLSGGGSQVFNSVAAGGGYSIVETLPANNNWAVSYQVSTGEANTNFTVTAGQTVTITITNTYTPTNLSGMYQIVPNSYKTNDTVWIDQANGITANVKIPDPSATHPLVGD